MKFLPITVILTLFASLFMALIFIPVVGGLIGKRQPQSAQAKAALHAAELGDPREMGGLTGAYVRHAGMGDPAPRHDASAGRRAADLVASGFTAVRQGRDLLSSVEPDFMQVQVRARDNFSIFERDASGARGRRPAAGL